MTTTQQVLNESNERMQKMATSAEEKNRKRREARAKLKLVEKVLDPNKTAGVPAMTAPKAKTLTLPKTAAEAVKVISEKLTNGKADDDLAPPAFLDRNNPENEKAAVAAREKHAETIRNRPVPAAPVNKAPVNAKPTAKAAKPASMYQTTRLLVVTEPNISIEALMKKLKEAGFKTANQSTVATFRADTRNTMILVQKLKGFDLGVV